MSIGRANELEVLRGSIRDVTAGAAATIVIEGEAGIGKTRLLEDLFTIARNGGVRVFRGDAHPLERTRPFGAIVDALGIRLGSVDPRRAEIGQLLASREVAGAGGAPGGGMQFRVLEEIVELVEVLSDQGPVLVALDDLHWADSSTLLAFRWLMRQLAEAPLLLIGTVRPVPRTVELAQILDDARESGARLIRLQALEESDVKALAELELGVPAGPTLLEAVARAGGNPLWIVEMLRSMSAEGMLDLSQASATLTRTELSHSLRELIVRRVSYLSESTVGTLRIASLLGDAFAVIDLATVTGRRATDLVADLRDAIHAGLLADQGGALAFRHQLVREAIYEDIPQAARFALHREAARALESAGAPLAQVASQLILGALPGDVEAARSLRRAAHDAVPRAPGVACELLRRAEILLPDGHPDLDATLAELVEALFRAGQVSQAAGIAQQVLARSHDAGVDGPLRFGLIVALSIQGRTVELNRQVDVALSRSPNMPSAEQARILGHSSYGQTFIGDLAGAEAVGRRALELAERSGDAATISWTLGALATAVRTRGHHPEALELTDRAVRLARASPEDFAGMGNPHFIRGMTLCEADQMDEAALAFRDAATESERPEQAWVLPDVQLAWTELRFLLGQWEEAAPELEGGIEFARERGNLNLLSKARGYLALMAVARGDRTVAERALETPEARIALRQPGPFGAVVAYAAAMQADFAGQPGAALELLLPAWRDQVDVDNRHYERLLAPALVRLALTLDQPALALEVAERAEQGAALAPSVPSVQGAALRCRGLIERDPEMMLRAVERAADSRRVLDHAGSLEDAAKILALCQRTAESRALLAQAIDRHEAIGARSFAARAGASFRELGGRRGSRGRRRIALAGWESLTTSERAVAELVGEGLTNRAIARHLFTSPHTVNTHLRHAFQKLNVSTRAGLATKVSRERST